MLTKTQAVHQLRQLGAGEGDVVMIHLSFRSIGPVEGGPNGLIDAFAEAVGLTGTVLYPTFNFSSWTEGHYWDSDETPSEMGALTEIARQRPDTVRTPHPIYSFAALGACADEFAKCDDPEAFGEDSVFGLYPTLSTRGTQGAVRDLRNVWAYADGTRDTVAVAERLGLSVDVVASLQRTLADAGVLAEVS